MMDSVDERLFTPEYLRSLDDLAMVRLEHALRHSADPDDRVRLAQVLTELGHREMALAGFEVWTMTTRVSRLGR